MLEKCECSLTWRGATAKHKLKGEWVNKRVLAQRAHTRVKGGDRGKVFGQEHAISFSLQEAGKEIRGFLRSAI